MKILISIVATVTVVFVSLLSSCSKKEVNTIDGTYTGTFTAIYHSGLYTGSTTLKLKNRTFFSSGNTNRIPAGGSGTFSIYNNQINFKDTNFWTADFDWNLILSGKYNYTFDGKNLTFISDKNEVGIFRYELEKQ